ncbi:MAG: hypothetical protein J6X48_07190 [Lachnospiraceae bacterium]|nr:hypothetical protein [Lachnospiraceae bacterium]
MFNVDLSANKSSREILANFMIAAVSLFVNGFGIYLTLKANLGAAPWDVLNLGIAKSLGILFGTASIAVSLIILLIDIGLKEAIGLAMFIDAVVVGKSVDFFNHFDFMPAPKNLAISLLYMTLGLFIIGYTQLFYMKASLGCGPRDTLLVGITRRLPKIPIGVVGIIIQGTATLIGYFLGGPVGLGTIICALLQGPIMQLCFKSVNFDATGIKHENLIESASVFAGSLKRHGIIKHS